MTIIVVLFVLAAMGAGFRCKVLAIVPLLFLGILTLVVLRIFDESASSWIAMVLTAAGVQVGYLCGAFARSALHVTDDRMELAATQASSTNKLAPDYR